jgi:hypothetical protein
MLVRYAGAVAIVLLFFFGTLFVLDSAIPRWRNHARAGDAAAIKRALAGYYKTHGSYPGPTDTLAENLKPFLVDEGFLSEIPRDPLNEIPLFRYQYVSDGKAFYGLFIHLELSELQGETSGSACLVGVGIEKTRVFGDPPPPACPF